MLNRPSSTEVSAFDNNLFDNLLATDRFDIRVRRASTDGATYKQQGGFQNSHGLQRILLSPVLESSALGR
jgi:hypothetical protein